MLENQTFGQAIEALKQGKAVTREVWPGGFFVFMQVPAVISAEVVPKMQSLPQSIKDTFAQRGGSIRYTCQLAIVNSENLINGFSPSVSDVLAEDWVIFD